VTSVYGVRMARVNITVPDSVIDRARTAGLNVSRVATAALEEELDRLAKLDALDAHLALLDRQLGPVTSEEAAEAAAWADRVLTATSPRRKRRPA
jgi:hypothetical protein